jgi:hypothetical protein
MAKSKNPIQVAQPQEQSGYLTASTPEEQSKAFSEYGKAIDDFKVISRTRDFSNLAPGVSGRPGLNRSDYDYFRPDEATPKGYKNIIYRVENAYQRVGLIKNIIDLMGDFTSQGIRIVHPNKAKEKILNDWYKRIGGDNISERLCNLLYRHGIVIIQYYTAKIRNEDEIALASPDQVGLPKGTKLEKKEIPFKYVFHNPTAIEVIGGPLSSFINKPIYGYKVPDELRKKILAPVTPEEKEVVEQLPAYVVEAAKTNTYVVLPQDKLCVYNYKKDDWMTHANPMIYSVLDDIDVLEKLKLADLCALDGATSKIRVFKLGNIEHRIYPNAAAFAKLGELLENNVGGGTMDIVWGPDVEILETKGDSYNYLGEDKYKATLNNIYAALGIPPTLTGTFGASGTTNNFISLKTLTERLEYGRGILTAFWTQQLALVQKSLGMRLAAQIEYDKPILANEDTEKKILMDMVDRNIISEELVRRRLGANDNMENIRLKREHRQRKNDVRVPKAGPWFDPHPEEELKKIALQGGQVTPSEVGLELEPKKPGEKKMMDVQLEMKKVAPVQKTKKKGQPGQGRPKMKKDSTKRKTKTVRPRTKGTVSFWAKDAQNAINEALNPVVLAHFNKKNMRSLTDEEWKEAESIKFGVLCNIEPFSELTDDVINASMQYPIPSYAKVMLDQSILDFTEYLKRSPNIDEIREMQCSIYTDLYLGEEDENL